MNIMYTILILLFLDRIKSRAKGNLIIELPNKKEILIGNRNEAYKIKVLKIRSIFRLLIFGLSSNGYSYYKGEWTTTDLKGILTLGIKNIKLLKSSTLINKFVYFFLKKLSLYKSNSINRSKKQIKYHYDLGNSFYSMWLDKSMTYSSAIYDDKNYTLEDAQKNKFESIIKLARIKKDSKVLEIGCGWGGFMTHVLKKIKADITGITLSSQQYKYVKDIITRKDRVRLLDYRNINRTYDKIISIEMFEAVGKKNWSQYFKIINKSLKDGGTAVLQIITIDEDLYSEYQYKKDFIQKYIFPGGMLPTKKMLQKLAVSNKLRLKEKKSFGQDYAKTLNIWRKNFSKNWEEIEKMGFDIQFKRLWEYYLCYCEVGFEAGTIDVSQFLIEKKLV